IKTRGHAIPEVDPLLEQIDQTVKRMSALVTQLLEINRLEVGRFEMNLVDIELWPHCKEIVEQNRLLAARKSIRIEYDELTESPVVGRVDAGGFCQMVDNLLSNAVKYSPPGTQIRCRLEIVGTRETLPDLILIDRKIRFVVED